MSTPSILLASSHGVADDGLNRCYFCGCRCEGEPLAGYVKDTFTGYNSVACPGSERICKGCVLAMRSECVVDMIDGSRFEVTRGGLRLFSWVLTEDRAIAASKAHLDALRAVCLSPPEPPYAIVLSDSGQTHQIYRGIVGRSRDSAVLTLETMPVHYRPDDLADLLTVAGKLAACMGKPALTSVRLPVAFAAKAMDRYSDGNLLIGRWVRVAGSPLGRLAAWLCPRKEDCERVYPSDLV